MRSMILSKCVLGGVAAALLLACTPADAQKLYRWTDKDGKVHYSDQVPPDAIDNERSELNQQGIAVKHTERALTDEERAAKEAEQARLAAEKKAAEEHAQRVEMLMSAYPDEAALQRAYQERVDLLEQSLVSARTGVISQQKSLNDLLDHAASLERAGKMVPKTVNTAISLARSQLDQQNTYLLSRENERKTLDEEHKRAITEYREAVAELAAKKAERDGGSR